MTFTTSDAWLLEAIILSERSDSGATLTDIIASADYISHAIMTFAEFDSSTKKLIKSKLIIEKDKHLLTTEVVKNWWQKKYGNKSRFAILKAMEEIEKFLNKNYGTLEESLEETHHGFTEEDLNEATAKYIKLAQQVTKPSPRSSAS